MNAGRSGLGAVRCSWGVQLEKRRRESAVWRLGRPRRKTSPDLHFCRERVVLILKLSAVGLRTATEDNYLGQIGHD